MGLAHFLQRAAERHLLRFDAWFPPVFDWERFCADVPEIARRAGAAGSESQGARWADELEERARQAFRVSHLYGLAIVAAGANPDEDDPEAILADLTSADLDEDEEELFADLVQDRMGAVEEVLEGGGTDDEEVAALAGLAGALLPLLDEVLSKHTTLFAERVGGPAEDVVRGVVRVGGLLAVFRALAAGRLAA